MNYSDFCIPAMEPAMEGFFDNFLGGIFSRKSKEYFNADIQSQTVYKDMLGRSKEIFGKKPETAFYGFTFKYVIVNQDMGFISIQNINFNKLFSRIVDTYGEKKLDAIFYRTYAGRDIVKYNHKKKSRGQMKITSLMSPIFFALELSILFNQLYAKYNDGIYEYIADQIYKQTWLSRADTAVVESVDVKYAQSMLEPRFKLKPHQTEFIEAYPIWKAKLNLRGVYNAFDQGLGKTLTALSLAMALHIDKIYVVCPNTLVANWYNETMEYYGGRVIPFDCKGSRPDKKTQVFIVNNESIKNIMPYVDRNCKNMLIVDEGHNFRNLKSTRVQELNELRKALNTNEILLLSGTPLKATPNELTPAFLLLDPTFTDVAAVMYNRCFNFDSYQAMEIVTARLGKMIYRKMKKDVLELPEKRIDNLSLSIRDPSPYLMSTINEEVREACSRIAPVVLSESKNLLESFRDTVRAYSTAGNVKTNWYLYNICRAANPKNSFEVESLHELDNEELMKFLDTYVFSNPQFPQNQRTALKAAEGKLIHYDRVITGRAVGEVYPPKRSGCFNAIWDENEKYFLDTIRSNDKKVVIFSQFYPTIIHIRDRLKQNGIGVVTINGSVNTGDRAKALNAFKHDDNIRVIVATSQSMGTGVTLIEANLMFFFGSPWRSADFDQCCDRIYRIGQDTNVQIYNVLLETTELNISTRIDKILQWSSKMFGAAMDDLVLTESFGEIDRMSLAIVLESLSRII